ncbi:MAG: thymidine kinase [Deltaproteobacteria bacterium]|nr:thymidine kinase [Deltaproteobacteria bacterium]
MFHKTLPGFIEVICGSMFSGKTEELVRRLKRAQIAKQKVQVFKPAMDHRYSKQHIQSHDANRIPSQPIKKARDIFKLLDDNTRVVGIDEVQFFDDTIIEIAQKLAYRGIRVILAGLDMDFRGQPFGPMPKLLAVAEHVVKLTAICVICGNPATRTQRISGETGPNAPKTIVGGKEIYEARCRFCHDPYIETALQEHTTHTIATQAQELN